MKINKKLFIDLNWTNNKYFIDKTKSKTKNKIDNKKLRIRKNHILILTVLKTKVLLIIAIKIIVI